MLLCLKLRRHPKLGGRNCRPCKDSFVCGAAEYRRFFRPFTLLELMAVETVFGRSGHLDQKLKLLNFRGKSTSTFRKHQIPILPYGNKFNPHNFLANNHGLFFDLTMQCLANI